ncbi:TetR/AcrR family transcriptional regulator [Streptomyces sp. SBT349]|uniref:TetR/AcrR family transcriptional regulator n=1 Tax=Streptomyces sp. SBT349 TaxID=1580539 RepID=UPI00069E6D13|nr:TetR/AcrR family transcriptional regulator [Streptomyces sp. SBT349]
MHRADQPVSRRTRPAKAALTRDGIVDAALAVLDADGLDAVSMRRVAQLLDTGAASLYVYVGNRDELLALMLDRVLAAVPLPGAPAAPQDGARDWRERLLALLYDVTVTLSRRRGIASVAFARVPDGPHALAIAERVLDLLAEGGVEPRTRAWALDTLMMYVSATALELSLLQEGSTAGEPAGEPLAVPADRYPRIAEATPFLGDDCGMARLSWALNALVNGVLATAVEDDPR